MAVAKRYVPNKAPKKKNGYCLDTKSPAANKQTKSRYKNTGTKELSKFFLREAKGAEKAVRRKALKRMQ